MTARSLATRPPVRRQLEQAEQAHVAGEISDEDLARVQAQAVDLMLP